MKIQSIGIQSLQLLQAARTAVQALPADTTVVLNSKVLPASVAVARLEDQLVKIMPPSSIRPGSTIHILV